jgi:predicted amidohydrolase
MRILWKCDQRAIDEHIMRIYLSRFQCLDVLSNLRKLEEESAQAAAAGTDLCVFPESFLHGYTRAVDPGSVRKLFAEISSSHPQTAFLFGSFTEARRNRMTFWQGGSERAHYDKVHLFGPNGEFELWEPGDRYVAVRFQEWTLGLVNCNDIRFPEQARMLRMQARCDALITVAWWPWRRDHVWKALLRARAIENGVFVAGCCIAGSQHPKEDFAGAGNHVFDPLGDPIATTDDHTYDLDRSRFGAVLIDPLKTCVDVKRVEMF